MKHDPYLPQEAIVVARQQESPHIVSLWLKFTDAEVHANYQAQPGQFNMLYAYGEGEVPISVSNTKTDEYSCIHTIRAQGHVTKALQQLKPGDTLGIRGPFGKGWPLELAKNKEIIIISGGIGCAPTIGAIEQMLEQRDQYKSIHILYGVKESEDLLFQNKFEQWQQQKDIFIHLATENTPKGKWHKGYITDLISQLPIKSKEHAISMMCGPEQMMHVASEELLKKGLTSNHLFLSLERNMQCGIGHCGHCQCGKKLICQDGPVFSYDEILKSNLKI